MNKYSHKRWKVKRNYILDKQQHLDQELLRYGKHVEADTVHHIFPVEFYPELKYEDWNLIALSRATHNACHQRTSHNLTQKGLDIQRRHKRDYERWCRLHDYQPHYDN